MCVLRIPVHVMLSFQTVESLDMFPFVIQYVINRTPVFVAKLETVFKKGKGAQKEVIGKRSPGRTGYSRHPPGRGEEGEERVRSGSRAEKGRRMRRGGGGGELAQIWNVLFMNFQGNPLRL